MCIASPRKMRDGFTAVRLYPIYVLFRVGCAVCVCVSMICIYTRIYSYLHPPYILHAVIATRTLYVFYIIARGMDCRDSTDEPQQCDVNKIRSGHLPFPLHPTCPLYSYAHSANEHIYTLSLSSLLLSHMSTHTTTPSSHLHLTPYIVNVKLS
jgi:hypothetical protein